MRYKYFYTAKSKNEKNYRKILHFRRFFFLFLEKFCFLQSVYGKNIVENPEKTTKNRKNWKKKTVDFSVFGKIFQSFRKSYNGTVWGEKKIETKKWKKREKTLKIPYGRVFGKSSEKHTKISEFQRKKKAPSENRIS